MVRNNYIIICYITKVEKELIRLIVCICNTSDAKSELEYMKLPLTKSRLVEVFTVVLTNSKIIFIL